MCPAASGLPGGSGSGALAETSLLRGLHFDVRPEAVGWKEETPLVLEYLGKERCRKSEPEEPS